MLSQSYRFKGHHSVSRVRGSVVRSNLLSVRIATNQLDAPRCAVVVSKKIAPLAVVRNRIRRRVFELLRQYPVDQLGSYDIVVYVQSSQCADVHTVELQKQLYALLQKGLHSIEHKKSKVS